MRALFMSLMILTSCPLLAQIQEYHLDNGLKILVKEDHRAPVVVSMVWYNVGSADEPGGITGVSHALEHLMFKGTIRFPLGVFSKTIADLGGQENAFTNTDYTTYFEKIGASHLDTCLELEADRMQQLQFNPTEFAKEIKVIQEERRLRTDDNPQALAFERFLAAANVSSPYQHPIIGWMSDLEELQPTDASAWYHRYYAPNNATLVVIGDINPADVHALAKKYFGSLLPRTQPVRKLQTEPQGLGKKQLQIHAPAQVPAVIVGYTVPSLKTAAPEKGSEPYALEVIAGILDAGNSSRFNEHLVQGKHIASSMAVQYNLYSRYQTQFTVYGTPNQTHTLAELKQGIFDELKRLQHEPLSETELSRIKTQIIAEKTYEKDSIFAQAMELGLLETIGLSWQVSAQYIDRIAQITPAQIQSTAQHYFNDNNLTVADLIPSTSDAPRGNHP